MALGHSWSTVHPCRVTDQQAPLHCGRKEPSNGSNSPHACSAQWPSHTTLHAGAAGQGEGMLVCFLAAPPLCLSHAHASSRVHSMQTRLSVLPSLVARDSATRCAAGARCCHTRSLQCWSIASPCVSVSIHTHPSVLHQLKQQHRIHRLLYLSAFLSPRSDVACCAFLLCKVTLVPPCLPLVRRT
jgi:hypothetical protein